MFYKGVNSLVSFGFVPMAYRKEILPSYSVERSKSEEVPLPLVDLGATRHRTARRLTPVYVRFLRPNWYPWFPANGAEGSRVQWVVVVDIHWPCGLLHR